MAVYFHCMKQPSARVLQFSLSFAVLVHVVLRCPTLLSLQWRFGLPTNPMPFVISHYVFVMVHILPFVRAKCQADFLFAFVTYVTTSVTLVLCVMTMFRILSFSLTFSSFLSVARCLVSGLFTIFLCFPKTFHSAFIFYQNFIFCPVFY